MYDTTLPVEFPIIIFCPNCAIEIEVAMKGDFICPACEQVGQINELGLVRREKAEEEEFGKGE